MAQRCFKVATRAPTFPTKGDGVSRVESKDRCAWDLGTSSLRPACLACPLWKMLGNYVKALPGTAAKKSLVSPQAAHRRAAPVGHNVVINRDPQVTHTFAGARPAEPVILCT